MEVLGLARRGQSGGREPGVGTATRGGMRVFGLPGGSVIDFFEIAGAPEPARSQASLARDASRTSRSPCAKRADLEACRKRFKENGVPILEEHDHGGGRHSIYVRDPNRHYLELTCQALALRWGEFAEKAPALAERGPRAPVRVRSHGAGARLPRDVARRRRPAAPSRSARGSTTAALYVFVIGHSPKRADLARDGRYALHPFPGQDDDEASTAPARARGARPARCAAPSRPASSRR